MLLRFRAANVLSIRDEQTLMFVATELNDGSARSTSLREDSKSVSVVPVVGSSVPTLPARPRSWTRSS